MDAAKPIVVVDRREPWPHPWAKWLGAACELRRGWDYEVVGKDGKARIETWTQPTGDFCLASGFDYSAALGLQFHPRRLVERKTCGDWYSVCVSPNRERFEKELGRMYRLWKKHSCWSAVVVECSADEARRFATIEHDMKPEAYDKTVEAYEHFAPIVFCDNERAAAWWSLQFLKGAM